MDYQLVSPERFSEEQSEFVAQFRQSVSQISDQTDMIVGAKDANSRHLASSDAYARIVALKRGDDVVDRLDKEMPCEGTAQFADCYVQEDLALMRTCDPARKVSILNVHEYGDGLKARVFSKHLLKHEATRSILGTIYYAHEIEIANFINLMPNYILEFGAGCSIEQVQGELKLLDVELTEYEQEVCFLMLLNWDFKQIADFMNKYRPKPKTRVADSIIKSKNYICEKLGLPTQRRAELCDALIAAGMHRKMPTSLFSRLIGSKQL
ncbi:hypothetical protein HA052_01220 [Chromobacterium haemolyticum]|uniref:Uncharacterized protein n=1 Tax=Chromobacterium fluminis TaxID=3044269 RepID=A0ABX0KW79_9NEIS|nr:hypothetical protein [Chromobacterium haemolyticum]NHR03804.1 hypothetical protein [Chromobacterium haemolyticum]